MKFSKKNMLFKIMFIVLMTFICFNVCDVRADSKGSVKKTNNYCIYDSEDTLMFGYKNNDADYAKVFSDSYYSGQGLVASINDIVVRTSTTLYCPEVIVFCKSSNTSGSAASLLTSKDACSKLFPNATNPIVKELQLVGGQAYSGYNATKNPGVCIHTSNNAEFAGIYQSAKELKKAVVYSSENDTRATRINNYINRTINKAFCDQEELKVLSDAITNWGTVVSKDPSANRSQKDKAQEQTENTTKNLEDIISNMQNSANISMPDDNPVSNNCEGLIDKDLKNAIDIALNVVRIVVPILLIVLTTVDFGQVVISNDKDAMPKAISKAIKRGIAALVIFFIPFLVDLIIDWLNTYSGINGAANCIK